MATRAGITLPTRQPTQVPFKGADGPTWRRNICRFWLMYLYMLSESSFFSAMRGGRHLGGGQWERDSGVAEDGCTGSGGWSAAPGAMQCYHRGRGRASPVSCKGGEGPADRCTSMPAAGPGGKSLSSVALLSPGMRLWTPLPWKCHPTGLHNRRPIAQDLREKCGRMISTGGALSPQGPMWAAAKSILPGFPQVGSWMTFQRISREAARWGHRPWGLLSGPFWKGRQTLPSFGERRDCGKDCETAWLCLSLQSSPFQKLVCCRGPALGLDAWQRNH